MTWYRTIQKTRLSHCVLEPAWIIFVEGNNAGEAADLANTLGWEPLYWSDLEVSNDFYIPVVWREILSYYAEWASIPLAIRVSAKGRQDAIYHANEVFA